MAFVRKLKINLATQIFIGLLLGVVVGASFSGNPALVEVLNPIGKIFLNLIKMIVLPIIVSTLITGIAGLGNAKKVGKIGGKTIVYFEVITTVALVIGLLAGNLVQPGSGISIGNLTQGDISSYTNGSYSTGGGVLETLYSIFPSNIFESLAQGNLLAVIFFSILFGLGLSSLGDKGNPLLNIFSIVADTMFWVTNQVMKVAPIGVFALIGVTVAKFGVASLLPLGKLVLTAYGVMIFFVLVVFGTILRICHVRPMNLVRLLKDEIILAFSTASSETVLPRLMEKLPRFGCSKETTSFVIPIGYSFNLDGGALYQSLAVLFVAQLYGIRMSIGAQIAALLLLMLTTKGLAGVPGANIAVLLATFGPLGLPVGGLAFIIGVDRLIDMGRTTINVLGNSIAAIVISKWEGSFDTEASAQVTNPESTTA